MPRISKKKQLERMSKEVRYNKRRSHQPLDQIDRIRAHMFEGAPLWKRDERLMDIAHQIYPLLCSGRPTQEVVKYLDRAGICKKSSAYEWINKTKKIFADPEQHNPDLDRAILVNMAREAYRIAKDEKDAKGMNAAVKLIAQLQGAFEQDNNLTLVFEGLQLPAIEITDNSAVIDIPFEEVSFEE